MGRPYKSGHREWFNSSANRVNDVDGAFQVTGLAELSKKLDAMLTTNPEMEKRIRRIIGKALKHMQTWMSKQAAGAMDSDPRKAYKAVRYAVYRRLLGGNVNILQRRKAGEAGSYMPERHPSHGRGGNRKARSERTANLEGYQGADRGFILRFINGGARVGGGKRQLRGFKQDSHRADVRRGSQGGDINKYGNRSMVNTGNRGAISPRNFFDSSYMGMVAEEVEREIDKLIAEEFKTT